MSLATQASLRAIPSAGAREPGLAGRFPPAACSCAADVNVRCFAHGQRRNQSAPALTHSVATGGPSLHWRSVTARRRSPQRIRVPPRPIDVFPWCRKPHFGGAVTASSLVGRQPLLASLAPPPLEGQTPADSSPTFHSISRRISYTRRYISFHSSYESTGDWQEAPPGGVIMPGRGGCKRHIRYFAHGHHHCRPQY